MVQIMVLHGRPGIEARVVVGELIRTPAVALAGHGVLHTGHRLVTHYTAVLLHGVQRLVGHYSITGAKLG